MRIQVFNCGGAWNVLDVCFYITSNTPSTHGFPNVNECCAERTNLTFTIIKSRSEETRCGQSYM